MNSYSHTCICSTRTNSYRHGALDLLQDLEEKFFRNERFNFANILNGEQSISDIASGWVRMHRAEKGSPDRGAYLWAYLSLDDLRDSDLERCWKIILEIRRIDDSDSMLANLAAGPVEDLLAQSGDLLIDRIEAIAKKDRRFKDMLGMVWKNNIPDPIWERLRRAAI